MNSGCTKQKISLGLALFSMFFGAGNIIFPLAIGQYAGDKSGYAVLGLIITAVAMPFAGVLAIILYEGDQRRFFERLGKIPGFIIALAIITLLGPLGSTPRCIALTYSCLREFFPHLSLFLFNLFACLIIFAFTIRKNTIISLLGYFLTPLLLGGLSLVIFQGLRMPANLQTTEHGGYPIFIHGLVEGYNTMDLMAAFFFSSTIFGLIANQKNRNKGEANNLSFLLQSSLIGSVLLAAVYTGFTLISALHGYDLGTSNKDELLSALILKIGGTSSAFLVVITISLACLTTAIALISVFADFIQKNVFNEKLSYPQCLIGSLLLTFAISTLEFSGIAAFLGPVLQIIYPGLIALTVLNIAHQLTGFKPLKIPVFIVFIFSAIFYFFP